jgi:hypothetical protein
VAATPLVLLYIKFGIYGIVIGAFETVSHIKVCNLKCIVGDKAIVYYGITAGKLLVDVSGQHSGVFVAPSEHCGIALI